MSYCMSPDQTQIKQFASTVEQNEVALTTIMTHGKSSSGEEPEPTPVVAAPTVSDFMDTIMARFSQQKEAQKATNEQLTAWPLLSLFQPDTPSTIRPFEDKIDLVENYEIFLELII